MQRNSKIAWWLSAFSMTTLAGCTGEEDRNNDPISMADLGLQGESYDDVIPADYQSIIAPTDPAAPTRDVDEEIVPATAEIDARGDRVLFPMHRGVRSFESHADLVRFVIDNFGATEEILDDESGELVGARGSYIQRGTSLFEDERLGVRYRVSDPVLAYVAGTSGYVEVAGEKLCFDPDGECGEGPASYLDPVGELTAPTHFTLCGGAINVCVEFHSFFNKTWFPVPWARHGSNVRFTTFSALPSTRLSTSGAIHVPPGSFDPFVWSVFPMPSISNQGEDSIETAVWCFGTTACVEYQATAVCGLGSVQDPDVNGSRRTGNGPANNLRCPS